MVHPMTTFVLVQGGNLSTDTWNRLAGRNDYPPGGQLGGKYWDGTVAALAVHGHQAFAPTLEDEHTTGLSGHIEQIYTLIDQNRLWDLILVGHSYGGMIITGVADRMLERIRSLVYLDAALPAPGQSLFDLFSSEGSDPLSFTGLEPAKAYIEKIRFDPKILESIQKTYILCTKSEFAVVTGAARRKIEAAPGGWTYLELPSSHVPMADMPDEVVRILMDVAKQ
ncbi:MAG: Alpha/beta hydrolase family protein [Methanoregulaceae archaeon PtaU1.Bin222]|nr:MAG: Alpha/beta hydrolase family protein [Methanoregulaceae archaeon PtaU1.Bin222]